MRSVIMAALAVAGLSTPARSQTPLEAQVLSALNAARTNPAAYAETLKEFRGFFHANLIRLPGSRVWSPVVFHSLPTGEKFVHLSARATPKVS